MRFDWDERKRLTNIKDHGFDFADAWEIFESDILVDIDDREDYGEDRWTGVGLFRGRTMVVVFTERDDDLIHVISVRKATDNERKAYEKRIFENRSGTY